MCTSGNLHTQELAEQYPVDFDPRSLRQDEAIGGIDGLRRRLADARFADLAIDRDEIAEWLSAAPQAAIAFARLVWVSAYLKCRYPAVFAAALLNAQLPMHALSL